MRGTFTTTTYDSRDAFTRQLSSGIHVCHNEFTNVGFEWIWHRLVGVANDTLSQASIWVGDSAQPFNPGDVSLWGEQTANAGLDSGFPEVVGAKVTLRATFGERDAIFDWAERAVVTASGVLLDRAVGDQGRKVLGAVWVVEAELELGIA